MRTVCRLFTALLLTVFLLFFTSVHALTPGKNLLTGTASPLDFESDTLPKVFYSYDGMSDYWSVEPSVIDGEENNHVMRVAEPTSFNYVRFPFSPVLTPERAYYISFKAYKTSDGTDNNTSLWIMKNDAQAKHIIKDVGGFKVGGGKWYEHAYFITNFAYFKDGTDDPTDITSIMFEWPIVDNANSTNTVAYFDDISIIPAYRVTYLDKDDSVLRAEYVYEPGKTAFAPSLTDAERDAFITGFSTNPGGDAVSSVPYEYHDIVLYAVYDNNVHLLFDTEKTLLEHEGDISTISVSGTQLGQSVPVSVTYSVVSGSDTVSIAVLSGNRLQVTSVKEGVAVIRAAASTGEYADLVIANDYGGSQSDCLQKQIDLSGANKVGHHNHSDCYYDAASGDYLLVRRNDIIKPATGAPYTDGFIRYDFTADTSVYPYLLVTYKADAALALQMRYTTADAPSSWLDVARPTLAATNGEYVTVSYNVGSLTGGKTMNTFVIGVTTSSQTVPFYLHDLRFSNIPTLSPETEVRSMVTFLEGNREIIEDGGTLNLRAAFVSNANVSDRVIYSLDQAIATIEENGDGSITLHALKNGTVQVTATAANTEARSDSVTVTISGQREKIPVYDISVMFWGASTLKHSPNESLGWTGNWGMAASSEDKDFAHRYLSRVEEAFAPCHITSNIYASSAYDSTINTDANNTYDYTKHNVYTDLEGLAKQYKPDILLCSVTGNMSSGVNPDAAKRAYTEAFDMLFANAPELIVFDQYCGIGHNGAAENVHRYLAERYTAKRFISFHANLAGHHEFFAREWLEKDPPQPGVAAHFNDAGMDELSRQMFEATVDMLRMTLKPTAFLYLPESIAIVGADAITEEDGKITLSVTASPADATNLVRFSVDDERIASIDENGVLTALHNGTVTVTAVCLYDASVTASKTVTVSGQPDAFTLTFAPGTTDPVTRLPLPLTLLNGNVRLPDTIPLRDEYTFVGWSLVENSDETVTSVNMTADTTVYALWKKTNGFEFDGSFPEGAAFTYGFTIEGGFHAEVTDGALRAVCTDGEKVRFISPKLDIADADTIAFALTSAYFDANSRVVLTVRTAAESRTFAFPLNTASPATYLADISGLDGTVTSFDLYVDAAPADRSMFPVSLDFVRFGTVGEAPKTVRVCTSQGRNFFACYDCVGRLVSVKAQNGASSLSLTPEASAVTFKWFRFGINDAYAPLCEPVTLTFAD